MKKKIRDLQEKECFIVCADFVNNHKHFKRTSGKPTDPNSRVRHQSVSAKISPIKLNFSLHAEILEEAEHQCAKRFQPGARYLWHIRHLDEKHDAYELAKECLNEWDGFLKVNHLL